MLVFITVLHILICLFLIVVILLQSGKAGDIASAFGGLGSQTAFGPRGAQTALGKATIVCTALFMITCIGLAVLQGRVAHTGSSILETTPVQTSHQAPAHK